jgi:nicotinate-nucleotide pyrophosphorylase (carboxylating)
LLDNLFMDDLLRQALAEDIGAGDITTRATVPAEKISAARLIAKEAGVICGLPLFARVFSLLDSGIKVAPLVKEGDEVEKGSVLATIEGNARSILMGERVALNFLQRMSGIATKTRAAVNELQGTNAKIADTRKTTPLMRDLEKYAVRMGGGTNHRFNLCDGILIKDNHIKAAGGITEAVLAARAAAPHTLKVEVEVESFAQIEEALRVHADIIMLDNMSIRDMRQAVEIIDGRAIVEASGNMGDKDLKQVAETGVDLISIGALTHSVHAMDLSLRFS